MMETIIVIAALWIGAAIGFVTAAMFSIGRAADARLAMTAEINVRINPKLKTAAQKAAKLDSRSLSSLIEKLLTEHCGKVGTLKRDQ